MSGEKKAPSATMKLVPDSFVNGAIPEPSAFMTQMLMVPFVLVVSLPSSAREDSKIILPPSGDHDGKKLGGTVSLVSGAIPEPSACIVQMFWAPNASLPFNAAEEKNTTDCV